MRLGLFGGTFDPPHAGHLIVAQDAWQRLGLERVIFIPAAVPPHKQNREVSPAQVRLAMLREATAGDERFAVDDLEVRRGGPSFTVDSLRAYREKAPDAELFLILGTDQYAELHTWRESEELKRLATLAVMGRGDAEPVEPGERVVPLPVTRIDISATEIRRRVAAREPIRYLVPPGVEALIARHQLYTRRAAERRSG